MPLNNYIKTKKLFDFISFDYTADGNRTNFKLNQNMPNKMQLVSNRFFGNQYVLNFCNIVGIPTIYTRQKLNYKQNTQPVVIFRLVSFSLVC